MTRGGWRTYRLPASDHQMAVSEIGDGEPLLFLHGSYDSLLLRPMAELFAGKRLLQNLAVGPRSSEAASGKAEEGGDSKERIADRRERSQTPPQPTEARPGSGTASNHRCVLYDQRGAGGSMLATLDERSLHIDRFLDDIEVLRGHLGRERVAIVGHSWGATLGLLYAGRFPQRIDRLVLVGMGPVSAEMSAVYHANVLRAMRPEDRARWPQVQREYDLARRSPGGVPPELDEQVIRAWAPVMFHSPERAEEFVGQYLAAGGWRRHAPSATGFAKPDVLANARAIDRPVLVLYGYQDYEPICQAYLIRERIPHAQVVFLNECGHMAWADQPQRLVAAVEAFLAGGGPP